MYWAKVVENSKLISPELRLERTLSPDEVQWNRVGELLTTRFKVPVKLAKKTVSQVYSNLSRPLELHWVLNPSLTGTENKVARSIAEVHGADRIKVQKEFLKTLGRFRFGVSQEISLLPGFGENESGTAQSNVTLHLLSKSYPIKGYKKIVALRLLTLFTLVGLYVSLSALLFYGLAALIAFILFPAEGIVAATSDGKLGLALLACLVGIAGLVGRVLRDLFAKVRRVFRG